MIVKWDIEIEIISTTQWQTLMGPWPPNIFIVIGIYQISVVKWPIIWIFTNGKFKFTTCHVISKFSFYVQKFIFYLYLALLYIVYIVCMINWTKRYTKICAFCVVYVLFAFLMVLFLEIVMAMLHSYTKKHEG